MHSCRGTLFAQIYGSGTLVYVTRRMCNICALFRVPQTNKKGIKIIQEISITDVGVHGLSRGLGCLHSSRRMSESSCQVVPAVPSDGSAAADDAAVQGAEGAEKRIGDMVCDPSPPLSGSGWEGIKPIPLTGRRLASFRFRRTRQQRRACMTRVKVFKRSRYSS
jgi:hypothetical protein